MTAYVTHGSEFVVNTTLARSQAQSDVNALADGSFISVWVDADFNTTAGRFIRAQKFLSDGTRSGGEITLIAANSVTNPAVTGLSGGGYVVSWDSLAGIKAQVYAVDGTASGAIIDVSPVSASSPDRPDVTALSNGGFAISWTDSRTSGGDLSGSGVHVRTFDPTGASVSGDLLVNTAVAGNQADASISSLSGGGFLVTWTDRGAPGSGSSWLIKGQVHDNAGVRIGNAFTVNTNVSGVNSVESSVTTLANGNFAVAWYEGNIDGSSGQRIQVVAPSGSHVGPQLNFSSNFSGTQTGPQIAALADGGFAVTWKTNLAPLSDGSGTAIAVQAFDATAQAIGDAVIVNAQSNGDQLDPAILGLANGGFIVSWTDLNGVGADDDQIRAQIFMPASPVAITSGGGEDSAAFSIDENQLGVTTISATANGSSSGITYAIVGGTDGALFSIDAQTGRLAFVDGADFESPADSDADNVYSVIVSATHGADTDMQTLAISVGNVNEAPVLTSAASFAVGEGATAVTTVSASDADGDTVTYAIAGGSDAARFTIDAATGALAFVAAPNFEAPADSDGNNVYEVVVAASDGSLSAESAVQVTVGNVNEAPVILSSGAYSVNENSTSGVFVAASDIDGDAVSYAIAGGADAARFSIDAASGRLSFIAAPNFEAPADADGDNVYAITVVASDGTLSVQKALSIAVVNTIDGMTVNGTSKANTLSGGAAEDTVNGLAGNDILYGLGGADTLNGGDGNDKLYGGAGADLLVGGSGADQFHFTSTSDSTAGVMDFIADFLRSQNDKVSLSAIDANSALAGDQAFSFIGLAAFSGVAGQLRYYQSGGDTFVAGDVNGDGLGDFLIGMDTALALTATDFIL